MVLELANKDNIQEELVQADYRMGNWVRRQSNSFADVLYGGPLGAMVLMLVCSNTSEQQRRMGFWW